MYDREGRGKEGGGLREGRENEGHTVLDEEETIIRRFV